MNGYKGQLGTFDPTKAKPIIVEGNTSQVDLTSQYARPRRTNSSVNTSRPSSQAGLPYSITYTDRTQFGPRIGFAWSPIGNTTVIRGGFGIFYEPEGTSGRVHRNILPFLLSETVNQTQGVVPNRTLANFFLGSQLGSALANPADLPTLTHLKIGSNQHYSLGVQQQLSPKTVFEIAYVGNHGVHLQSTDDFNDPTPALGAVQARRPYQPWGTITFESQDLGTTYQALQSKIQLRPTNGLTGLISSILGLSSCSRISRRLWGETRDMRERILRSILRKTWRSAEAMFCPLARQKVHDEQQSLCRWRSGRMAGPDHHRAAKWNSLYSGRFNRQGEHRRRRTKAEHQPGRRITNVPPVAYELV